MRPSLRGARAARIPVAALESLASLRARRDVEVLLEDDGAARVAWVRWSGASEEVVRRLLPVLGVRFFESAAAFEACDGWIGLASVLFPAPTEPRLPAPLDQPPLELRLVRAERPRATTAALVPLASLALFAEHATTRALDSLSGALADEVALVRGSKLPLLDGAVRLWGERLLAPLGFEVEPALDERVLLDALGVAADELLLFTSERRDVVKLAAFAPLTRAGVRLAARGARP